MNERDYEHIALDVWTGIRREPEHLPSLIRALRANAEHRAVIIQVKMPRDRWIKYLRRRGFDFAKFKSALAEVIAADVVLKEHTTATIRVEVEGP